MHQWRASGPTAWSPSHAEAGLFAPPAAPAVDVEANAAEVAEFYRRAALHELDRDLAEQADALALVSEPSEIVGYDGGARIASLEERPHQEQLLAALQSQLAARRALYPERPLYVLQFDLQDFFPSVSHEVTLAALAALGMNAPWRRLIARALRRGEGAAVGGPRGGAEGAAVDGGAGLVARARGADRGVHPTRHRAGRSGAEGAERVLALGAAHLRPDASGRVDRGDIPF